MTTRQPRDGIAPIGATDEKIEMQDINQANNPPPTIVVATALPSEYVAFDAMLDNRLVSANTDIGEYSTGLIASEYGGSHSVILISIGVGNNSAASKFTTLLHTMPTIKYGIVSGIAGGVPNPAKDDHDVRLGDIVVSDTTGVIQYDFLKDEGDYKYIPRHPPRPSDPHLLDAVQALRRKEQLSNFPWRENILRKQLKKLNKRPSGEDVLLSPTLNPVERSTRKEPKRPRVFYGPIASGDRLLKNVPFREYVLEKHGAKAVEMEAAGVAEAAYQRRIGILVVRGICDYCDKNKADGWQQYAAVVAAAYTRSIIQHLPGATSGSVASDRSTRAPGASPLGGGYTLERGSRTNPSVMLGASYRTLPFNRSIRPDDWNKLSEWWEGRQRFRICLLVGPGGAGKTRFAIEAATMLENRGWSVDFRASDSANIDNGSLDAARENLVVVDYAETRNGLAAAISSYLKSTKRVRLLLLARNKSEWWTMLRRHSAGVADALDNADEIVLNPLTPHERNAFYQHAYTAFSRHMSLQTPISPPSLDAVEFERPLYIAMAAYADLANIPWAADTLLDCILEHEERWWFAAPNASLLTANNLRSFRTVISSTTLLGGLESYESLHAVTASISQPLREHIVERTRTLYPGNSEAAPFVAPLQPDLLGEALVVRVLSDSGTPVAYLRNVLGGASERGARHLFFVVGRIDVPRPFASRISALVEYALADDSNWEYGVHAALALGRISPYGDIGHWLAHAVALSPAKYSRADALHKLLPPTTMLLAELAVVVSESKQKAVEGSGLDHEAEAADELAQRYEQSGRLQDALKASAHAVAVCARRSSPEVYDGLRLRCLTNYAGFLSADGKINESVRLYELVLRARRHAVRSHPRDAKHLSALALVLANLGIALGRLHEYSQATAYTKEALGIYRNLHASAPKMYAPDVARLLSNLAARTYEEGGHAEALAHCDESCHILSVLVSQHPDMYLVQWVEVKLQLATMQRELGRLDDSQTTCDDVVTRLHGIPEHTVPHFSALLARSYHVQAITLAATGKMSTSTSAIRQAVDLLRRRVGLGERGDRFALAQSIIVAGVRESELGRHEAAALFDEEAIQICLALERDSSTPDVLDLLAQAWFNLSNHRRLNHEPGKALEAAVKAADTFGSLARAAGNVGEVSFHSRKSLAMLGKLLLHMGNQGGAFEALLLATELTPSATSPQADVRSYLDATNDLFLSSGMSPDSRIVARLMSAETIARSRLSQASRDSAVSLARVLVAIANVQNKAGNYHKAIACAQESIDLLAKDAHEHPVEYLVSLDTLARVFGTHAYSAEALVASTKAASFAEGLYPKDSYELARYYGYVAFDSLKARESASGQVASRRALQAALPRLSRLPVVQKNDFLRWLWVYEQLLNQAGDDPTVDPVFSACISQVQRAEYDAAKSSPETIDVQLV